MEAMDFGIFRRPKTGHTFQDLWP